MAAPSITNLQYPMQAKSYRTTPVANGLYYMVSSNMTAREGLKYTADVKVNTTSVAKLKHDRDINASNNGVFNVDRLVENFLSTTKPLFTGNGGMHQNTKAINQVNLTYGLEFTRRLRVTSVTNLQGLVKMNFETNSFGTQNSVLRANDRVYIYNSTQPTYNGVWLVNQVGQGWVQLLLGYSTDAKCDMFEGENFYDNTYWYDAITATNMLAFAIPSIRPSYLKVGDNINVIQNTSPAPTYPAYNGEAKVMYIEYNKNIGGVSYTLIGTNKKSLGSTPVNGGIIYSTDKYQFNNLLTTPDVYAFDGGVDYLTYNSYDPVQYALNQVNTGKFLTNKPNRRFKVTPENFWQTLPCFTTTITGSQPISNIYVSYTTFAGATNNFSINLPLVNSLRTEIIANPRLFAQTSTLFNNLLNSKSINYYTVYTRNSTTFRTSEIFRFDIDYTCSKWDTYNFMFKNRLGGWDYFSFKGRADRNVLVERSNINKALNGMRGSRYGYDVGDKGISTYAVNAYDKETVNSNWVDNDDAKWLEELFTSPDIYLIQGTNTSNYQYIPIQLLDVDYQIGNSVNAGLINYTISFRRSYNKTTQRN